MKTAKPIPETENELLDRLRRGDHHAFTALYDRYKHPLYKQAFQKIGNADAVDDVMQDLFGSLWSNREKIQIHTSLANYLFKALRNRIIDYYLKDQNRKKYESLIDYYAQSLSDADHRIREKLYAEKIKGLIAHFPDKTRQIFQMRIFEDADNQQIAEKLQISEKTVRNNIWLVMKHLRSKLTISIFILFFFGTM